MGVSQVVKEAMPQYQDRPSLAYAQWILVFAAELYDKFAELNEQHPKYEDFVAATKANIKEFEAIRDALEIPYIGLASSLEYAKNDLNSDNGTILFYSALTSKELIRVGFTANNKFYETDLPIKDFVVMQYLARTCGPASTWTLNVKGEKILFQDISQITLLPRG